MKLSVASILSALVLTGCLNPVKPVSDEYDTLARQRQEILQRQGDTQAAESQLAGVATRATAAARTATGPDQVALYRLAMLSAWQAGELGESMVLGLRDKGGRACAQLPQGETTRPGDCSMIKLGAILAITDDLQRDLHAVQTTLETQRAAHAQRCNALAPAAQPACQAEPVKLPSPTLPELQRIFTGFERQFGDTSTLRTSMDQLQVDQTLKDAADTDRYIIYCSAVTAWGRMFDVEGVTSDDISSITARRDALRTQLEQSVQSVDCRTVAQKTLAAGEAPAAATQP
jgi:hypothetical protein